jgi:two-component system, NtrC family, sensor kinase
MSRTSFALCKATDMGLFDLSLRHKLPLWGGLLVIVTVVAITSSNLALSHASIKKNMLVRSEILGRSLAKTLYSAISQDDVWRAYEIINFPMHAEARQPSFQLEDFVVLDAASQFFISTTSKQYPLQTKLENLGPSFSELKSRLAHNDGHMVIVESDKILLAIPLVADGVTLGTLVLVHPANYYQSSFDRVLKRTAWTTLVVLLILLPISWYWGRRMASPLTLLADNMGDLGKKLPAPMPGRIYPHGDELGRLFQVYDQMQRELVEKDSLERQMMKSERLASLGRLTASIAHEINNPLGGLLTAVDTLQHHAAPDPVLERVLPLLERGLNQIKDIVGALLVEAKAKGRALSSQDIEDVHTLLAQEAKKRGVEWMWDNSVKGDVQLPATLVRQVLINLVLNAVQAAGSGGQASVRAALVEGHLVLEVSNNGRDISPELMEHLFEPFSGQNETGQGLGLWVTHQIVEQLRGNIIVNSEVGQTRFCVTLPLGEDTWPPASV